MQAEGWYELGPRTAGPGVRDVLWDMYKATYSDLGLILSGPKDFDEFDVWEVYLDDQGVPRAFSLAKTTGHGRKAGLSGTDLSKVGKRNLVMHKAELFQAPGFYGEVSHKVEELARKLGAPVVCAVDARVVLNKDVQLEDDGIHYTRTLANVGPVTKVMVGQPAGVSRFTTFEHASCPTGLGRLGAARVRAPGRRERPLSSRVEAAMLLADLAGL